jgi:hypothetical protein
MYTCPNCADAPARQQRQTQANDFLYDLFNPPRASGAAFVVTDPSVFAIRRPTRDEIAFVAAAIAQGIPVDSLGAFITSIGGRDQIGQAPGSGATLGRQFVVEQNRVPVADTSDVGWVDQRSSIYNQFDASLNSRGSVYRTNFMGAASDVTDLVGLSGAQAVATIFGWVPFTERALIFNENALADIRSLGVGLHNDINRPTYEALYNGNSNFRLSSGVMLGAVAQGGTRALDHALVKAEQTYVQSFLTSLTPERRANLISETNSSLNGPLADPATKEARRRLGGTIDFANQAHRELIGRITVDNVAKARSRLPAVRPPVTRPCRVTTSAGGCG